MIKGIFFVLLTIFVLSVTNFAQVKSITNADLKKYKQKRLKAERELRENYKQLGFPSPEELERRKEKSMKSLSELSERVRRERLESEANSRNNNNQPDTVTFSDSSEFIDYTQYHSFYTYLPRNKFNRRYSRFRRNNRFNRYYRKYDKKRYSGFIGPRRNNNVGTKYKLSRRLTKKNRFNSKRRNTRSGFGISIQHRRK